MLTMQRIPNNAENGHFSKVTYAAGGFTEANKYKPVTGDDRKGFGFGSKEASKRDEFSNTIRTEQYRATMRKEAFITEKANENNLDELSKILQDRLENTLPVAANTVTNTNTIIHSPGFSYSDQVPRYDIGRTRETPFDPRSKKDAYYKFDGTQPKRLGTHRPVSMEVGDAAWTLTYKPPSHGGKSEVKNFFDKSHLSVSVP